MKEVKLGLMLGNEISMPDCFEALLKKLDLKIKYGSETYTFDTERVMVEPFNIRREPRYDVVIDRVSHWHINPREWLKKIILDGSYVVNNPWNFQSMEKHTGFCMLAKLGFKVPETWLVPQKDQSKLLQEALELYSKLFDLEEIADEIGYPFYMKPYNGGGWVGVKKIENAQQLLEAYDKSEDMMMHLQGSIDFEKFCRALNIGPQVMPMHYDPDKPLHERYVIEFDYLSPKEWHEMIVLTKLVGAVFGWEYNSNEVLMKNEELFPIDFCNAVPDSSLMSLHFYFPWIIKSIIRWTTFVAVSKRKFPFDLHWQKYLDIAEKDMSYEDKLDEYEKLADKYFDTRKFSDYCEKYLGHLDEAAFEYFTSSDFDKVIVKKVVAKFPAHEHEEFIEHYRGLFRFWAKCESDQLAALQA
ncbi:MAG: RimK family alpha-L-glutamate ligase [Vulcanimicrobiota bacterium]